MTAKVLAARVYFLLCASLGVHASQRNDYRMNFTLAISLCLAIDGNKGLRVSDEYG